MKKRIAAENKRAVVTRQSKEPSKLGADELLALVNLWEMAPETRRRIRQAIEADADLRGPHLFRYYGKTPGTVARAEGMFAKYIGVKNCLGVNSGTSALIAALRAIGIGAGDEVIIPAYTFFATAAAVVVCNAIPVLCEVDETLNMDPKSAAALITPRTKALLPVHMRGAPARMDKIMALAKRRDLAVVEDVAQAAGGSFGGKRLGAIGDIGCFSLDYYKALATGEGGFLTTHDDYLFLRAQSWHDTAVCWRPDRYGKERVKGELFSGENYRMNELAGAIALPQIRKLDRVIRKMRIAKKRIKQRIRLSKGMTFRELADPKGDTGTLLVFFLPEAEMKPGVVAGLKAEGVPAASAYTSEQRDWHVYSYWDQILEMKSVARDGLPWSAVPKRALPKYSKDMCPRTLDLLSRTVSIAVSPQYDAARCRQIAESVNKVLSKCCGKNE